MRVEDLERAIANQNLLQSPAGWIIAESGEASVNVDFMATAPRDALRMLEALIDWSVAKDAKLIDIKLPASPWTGEALKRSNFKTKEIAVLSRPV